MKPTDSRQVTAGNHIRIFTACGLLSYQDLPLCETGLPPDPAYYRIHVPNPPLCDLCMEVIDSLVEVQKTDS